MIRSPSRTPSQALRPVEPGRANDPGFASSSSSSMAAVSSSPSTDTSQRVSGCTGSCVSIQCQSWVSGRGQGPSAGSSTVTLQGRRPTRSTYAMSGVRSSGGPRHVYTGPSITSPGRPRAPSTTTASPSTQACRVTPGSTWCRTKGMVVVASSSCGATSCTMPPFSASGSRSRMPGMTHEPLVLGIETSCDETGVGVVRGHTLLADAVASSVDEHARFGGVVPEVASRAHLEAMVPTVERACATAGTALYDVDAVAVTSGPGLAGALLVGVAAAKALAVGLGKPLYGVNHLAAHVAVDQLEHGPLPEPCVAMLVSGGHSSLLRVGDVTGAEGGVVPLGATIDDAAGEAFDKVARLLGLPFPGGPHIDRAARSGSSVYVDFPRGLTSQRDLQRHRFDFSFSGLKTAVARWVEARERAGEPVPVPDVAASFQEAVCDVLTRKAVDAAAAEGIEDILIGGGVAANSRLRALAEERAAARGIRVRVPRPGLCTDNGAMVAALGAEMVSRGRQPSALDLPADSSLPVTSVLV